MMMMVVNDDKQANGGVTIVGLVNELDELDDAIVRPGRLGTHIYVS